MVEALVTHDGTVREQDRGEIAISAVIGGRFRIDHVLGVGGMGFVVAATHVELGHRVAIKFMRDEQLASAAIVERFMREARAAAQLRTEHVCRVLDVARLPRGTPYIVMELLEGSDLARFVGREALAAPVAVEYVMQACVALAEAHAAGIVHRDLKPGNLFVTRRADGGPLVKVLDFGIAKAISDSDASLTRTRVTLGSPGYMSPEQIESARDVDARTDIWALGVTLYQLLSGRLPFRGPNATETAIKIASDPPDPIEVAPGLRAVVLRCLEKSPAQRYPDVVALARDLVPFGGPAAPYIARAVADHARRPAPRATPTPTPVPLAAHAHHVPMVAPVRHGRRAAAIAFTLAGLVAAGLAARWRASPPAGGSPRVDEVVGGSAVSTTSAGATVARGEAPALPIVDDCPVSLGGSEHVARTIRTGCGPVAVTSSLVIDGSLTLEAGVVLKFAPDTELSVGAHGPAKLIVRGGDGPGQRVVFTSGGDPAAGVWKGVALYGGADRSQISGLDLAYAGQPGAAAMTLRDAADVVLTRTTIAHAKDVGLAVEGEASFAGFTGNRFDDIAKIAMVIEPSAVGTLGAGNTFAPGAFIEIGRGRVGSDATWKNVGAPYHVTGEVDVETESTPPTLTISDATLAFAPGVELAIGYRSRARLQITGPAVLTGIARAPGSWTGVRVYSEGEAAVDGATFSGGGTDDGGALTAKNGARLTLGTVVFKDNKLGLWVDDGASFASAKPLTFTGNERAAHLGPSGFGALAGANVFAAGQIVEIAGGAPHADTTWRAQARVTAQVLGDVSIDDGRILTIQGGATYQWKAGASLSVGYNSPGTLRIAGRVDAPVVFTAIPRGDPWGGVQLYGMARATELSFLDLADVSGDGGVVARAGAVGTLDHVTCARCAATAAPACGAKLGTAAVTAGAGTAVAVVTPTGC